MLQVFEELDADHSGSIEYKELNKQLRAGASVKLDPKLQAGAAGEIQTKSLNKSSLRRAGKETR